MKEHPILFSTPMVQAILEGRKTQTRRIVPERWLDAYYEYDEYCSAVMPSDVHCVRFYEKQYFMEKCKWQVGGLLWVRESHFRFGQWRKNGLTKTGKQKWRFHPDKVFSSPYAPNFRYQDDPPANVQKNSQRVLGWYKRSSLFMPKEFARIWLEITNIKVERLQDISEEDAIAEGIQRLMASNAQLLEYGQLYKNYQSTLTGIFNDGLKPIGSFQSLWEKINGEESWNANPFVWVIEFKRISDGKN